MTKLESFVQGMINPLKRRVALMVSRAIVKLCSDTGARQTLQLALLPDEIRDGIERFQNYGFTSVPIPGAEAAVVFVGGDRANGLVIAVDDRRYRLKGLQAGEVALYTDEGDKIHFKRGRKIEITTLELTVNAETKAKVIAETAEVEAANVKVVASAEAEVQAPTIKLTASTKVEATTPLLSVSGVVACAGIAAGGATPESGKAKVSGSIEATGNVSDATGSMATMRGTYNGHTHSGVETGAGTSAGPNNSM